MQPSDERTNRMEQIFEKMRNLATASYPLLDELAHSPSPGERLAAVAILQVFATEEFFPFLLKLIGSEKPFVGYHATKALCLAVGLLDPIVYPRLLEAIHKAQALLKSASVGFDSNREALLRAAEQELTATTKALSADAETYD
jgi:HEAT repeat protein